jgi:CBS domain-containing protein
MTWNPILIDIDKTVFEAAAVMSSNIGGCLVVVDGGKPLGMVTEEILYEESW